MPRNQPRASFTHTTSSHQGIAAAPRTPAEELGRGSAPGCSGAVSDQLSPTIPLSHDQQTFITRLPFGAFSHHSCLDALFYPAFIIQLLGTFCRQGGQNSSALSTLINRPQVVGASCSHLLPSCAPCFVQERPRIVEPSLQGLPCARSHSSRNTRVKKKTTRPHRVLLCPAWPRSEKFTQELQQKQSPKRCKPDVREPDATQGRDPHGLTTTTACRGKQMALSYVSSCLTARCKGKERRAAEKTC